MNITTVVGCRPELIRLSRIIAQLDAAPGVKHRWIHTGQNDGEALKEQFYVDLGLRREDVGESPKAKPGAQWIGAAMQRLDELLGTDRPDRVLILGDTNSALATAYVARRLEIPIFHAEAGNRCFDPRSPEEVNRKVIDHLADVHLCYTEAARRNLANEGITRRVFVVGNPLLELVRDLPKGFGRFVGYLASLHRAENVDHPERVEAAVRALGELAPDASSVWLSVHPRLKGKLRGVSDASGKINLMDPCSFSEWVQMERTARCVLTDSGSEPEECALLGTPSVMLRDSTERPELLEYGCSVLAGCDDAERIVRLVRLMEGRPVYAPPAYSERGDRSVAQIIVQLVVGGMPL